MNPPARQHGPKRNNSSSEHCPWSPVPCLWRNKCPIICTMSARCKALPNPLSTFMFTASDTKYQRPVPRGDFYDFPLQINERVKIIQPPQYRVVLWTSRVACGAFICQYIIGGRRVITGFIGGFSVPTEMDLRWKDWRRWQHFGCCWKIVNTLSFGSH